MIPRRHLLGSAAALTALTLAGPLSAQSDAPMPVVATFSILGDMVERIGGKSVAVTTLVGRGGDAHVYQPTPADARAVSEADLLFVNGLEFEGWLDRLIDASAFDGTRVVATEGITPMAFEEEGHHDGADHDEHGDEEHDDAHHDDADHDDAHHEDAHDEDAGHDAEHHDDAHHDDQDHAEAEGHHHHGAFDPHAWQSLANARVYATNIARALSRADPGNAVIYEANAAVYISQMEALDAEIRAMTAALPADRRIVVTSHDAFQYFGRDYGLTFLAPQGLSTESEASAKDMAALIQRIRADGISAVFIENIADPRLLEQIARETGATIGGTLYPGALSEPEGPAGTYLDMMRHNAVTLTQALGS
ncbi:metal ABC transporter substrate-binding protein [Marinibacterium sp. SX1]|uniref:metal ABC transporter substrate-binding protein n=1 Tax=Marinibacterium sp. SX1 TaxID=3388424 RepID=UPI003D184082